MNRRAFTLIELLITVAIIAILAAIALPNFLEARTRSKVSRMQSDLRTLGGALEMYRVDNNAYPRTGPPGSCVFAPQGLPELTTPISYLRGWGSDVFAGDGGAAPIAYGICNDDVAYWYLWSRGPDLLDQHAMLQYDPTNGTISAGDLRRTSSARHFAE